ncbi:molybdate ABC transporter substrate-binding protein [Fusibacter sp. 3D3]|uniref:molybdate ABC transporter substrate-binding protein n=1 Tax=Fusibacter sp. 3D3 TaxID=1048380 RepID=UPI000858C0AC|nr:molybdate ABC transporter substrate-binding protein [Fusibacter sp. 3D3]GAU79934.1 molybdenum ABC transporter periplasmic molybdenum-binding protein ModA [Fusibacter sp. 3D3]
MKKIMTPSSKVSFRTLITLMLVTLWILSGCQSKATAANDTSAEPTSDLKNTPESVTLTVSAAASLNEALTEIKSLYETQYPGKKLLLNFASSGSLEQQIEQGAEVDVFLSASPKYTNLLKDKGLILEDTLIDLLKNEIVLVTNVNSPLADLKFEALGSADYDKIGIGEPSSVPAGQYGAEILTTLGIKDDVYTKAVFAKDVKEVLTWVETDNVDFGIVYSTDAVNSKNVKVLSAAPTDSHKAILYPAVVIKESKQPDEATHFLNFLSEEDTMAIFIKYGFLSAQ